ncbi:MAG TPA: pyridoxine 5'-phosphate synthase [Balneolaceae bacterium]|nr:pyridoxine 5'-phosphate synthase [Balneolaceae bacterium]
MQLLVNIDHVATLRNARGEGYPSPVKAAEICEQAGASGIVFHLREDRRHIRDEDVYALKDAIRGTIDFEMAATDEMLQICHEIDPDLITLVPEKREELTTEGGLDLEEVFDDFQSRVFPKMNNTDIKVSLFIDPNPEDVERAHQLGSDAIELHTGTYANAGTQAARETELERLKEAAEQAHNLGMHVNGGHGLNLDNVRKFVETVPHLHDVSIGHALISEALFRGLDSTVKKFLEVMGI